jgi:hypothetical protein
MIRDPDDQEEIRGARVVSLSSSAKRRDSRNTLDYSSHDSCVIQKAVGQAQASGTRPTNNIPQKLLSDSTFLNTLHSHVNQWIESIQAAVTKRIFWDSLSGSQLLAQFGESSRRNRSPASQRGCPDDHGLSPERQAISFHRQFHRRYQPQGSYRYWCVQCVCI